MRKTYFIVFAILLMFSTQHSLSQLQVFSESTIHIENNKLRATTQTYTPTSPIVITSNSDFTGAGFTGTGSINDPYTLSGVNITTNSGNAITINDTGAHYIIKDSFFKNSGSVVTGIKSFNTNNGMIENNIFEGFSVATNLDDVSWIVIHGNTFRDNHLAIGINNVRFSNFTSNSFFNNSNLFKGDDMLRGLISNLHSITNTDDAIYLSNVSQSTFSDILIGNSTDRGITLIDSSIVDLTRVAFTDIEQMAFLASDSLGIFLKDFTIVGSSEGTERGMVQFDSSTRCSIENLISSNANVGVKSWFSSEIEVKNSIIDGLYKGGGGIQIINTTDMTVQGTIIENFKFNGISNSNPSNKIKLLNNTLRNLGDVGMRLWTVHDTIISSNLFINISDVAFLIDDASSNIEIIYNSFIDNNLHISPQITIENPSTFVRYNYFNDWLRPDINNDGIIDYPYQISLTLNVSDDLPLAQPAWLRYSELDGDSTVFVTVTVPIDPSITEALTNTEGATTPGFTFIFLLAPVVLLLVLRKRKKNLKH